MGYAAWQCVFIACVVINDANENGANELLVSVPATTDYPPDRVYARTDLAAVNRNATVVLLIVLLIVTVCVTNDFIYDGLLYQ